MSGIGKRLKEARNKAGIFQADAAKALGLSRPTLSAIEAGKRQVMAEDIKVLAELYGVDTNELLYNKSELDQRKQRLLAYHQMYSSLTKEQQARVIDFMEHTKK